MEKPARSKGTIVLKYLQKAATFTITNNPHSPRGERLSTIRGLSGPIASIIPTEARHKKRNDDAFDEEPTSPKVTCIGQIKHKKTAGTKERKKKKVPSGLTRMFSQRVRPDHKEVMEVKEKKKKKKEKRQDLATDAAAPALGHLKKFASRRESSSLADFDWEKAAAAENSDYEEGKEDLMNVYHSAPLVLGGDVMGAEHKEIGLWRRRSIAALMPIEVNK
ncbi:uncharacterized protein At1g76070 [Dendrobium catenatum]|uniref:Uncharacterized protein n=1 Tax=Dendrobium catenatum TaxID=906689 RepID=A0A2I0VM83_9ASPA|nr:uncharacterized protein At1g76070 [Dendrobium catenatum]PKU64511.1 Uncharacterized protein MA16_Dca008434 [Dendrobium catenatum]